MNEESSDNNALPVHIEESEAAPPKKKKFPRNIEDAALKYARKFLPVDKRASERQFEEFYDKARVLYNAGKYKEALPHFLMLKTGDSNNSKYLFAVAACYHMMQDYKKAIEYYTLAAISDPLTPLPFYYASDCLIRTNDPFGALVSLDIGLKRGRGSNHSKIIERMESMVKRLENEILEKKKQSSTSFIGEGTKGT